MKKLLYLLQLLIFLSACYGDKEKENIDHSDEPKVPKEITRAETYYDMTITENELYDEIGDSVVFVDTFTNIVESSSKDIETNWDPALGIITFYSENPGSSPYPTVSIVYDITSGRESGNPYYKYVYDILQVNVSLQDVLIGTAAELNARTYRYPYLENFAEPVLFIKEQGVNYIEGRIYNDPIWKRVYKQGIFTGEVIEADWDCDFRVCTGC